MKNNKISSLILPLLLLLMMPLEVVYAQQGVIQGRIYNANNNEPVAFANVAVYGTSIGSTSDLDGNFLFTGLEPGYVELRVSSVGFETYISEQIQVTNAKKVFLEVPLVEVNVELEEVVVKASPFRKVEETPVSLQRIKLKEIEKSPGGNPGAVLYPPKPNVEGPGAEGIKPSRTSDFEVVPPKSVQEPNRQLRSCTPESLEEPNQQPRTPTFEGPGVRGSAGNLSGPPRVSAYAMQNIAMENDTAAAISPQLKKGSLGLTD